MIWDAIYETLYPLQVVPVIIYHFCWKKVQFCDLKFQRYLTVHSTLDSLMIWHRLGGMLFPQTLINLYFGVYYHHLTPMHQHLTIWKPIANLETYCKAPLHPHNKIILFTLYSLPGDKGTGMFLELFWLFGTANTKTKWCQQRPAMILHVQSRQWLMVYFSPICHVNQWLCST